MLNAPKPLQDHHDLSAFDCGEPILNEWLKQRARKNEVLGASRTFVVCNVMSVVGYYALAAGSVTHDLAVSKIKRNMPDPIPVIILGRLAIDQHYKRQGLGYSLLQDVLLRCHAAAQHIGARALLVHALSESAKQFYEHFGFRASPINERTLMILLSEIVPNY
ncbi:MAG: GNAT family N-acetyltransferase [Thiofilum sp.]|uniref:GNAT family N-acetyltransferase n=1 Tax=Thiofilum sp. TaxID=2212733 RepID=UPI0025D51DD9|nr:GNAT family N-acetyltransferase [Thiofilum sp.]MBK8452604.1 GNAT family N-acetyltransferase [Thiofilum sp.]